MSLERLFNIALGLSILGWGISHLTGGTGSVRLALALLNLAVGILILFRRPEVGAGTFGQIARALPAVMVGGAAVAIAPDPASWPAGPALLLIAGCAFTLLAFAFLGRSFAVLPSLRRVVVGGPYAFVRHPAYLGELTMLAACTWASGSWLAAPLVPLAAVLVALRIDAEEQVLMNSEAYASYRDRVRSRLVPGIW